MRTPRTPRHAISFRAPFLRAVLLLAPGLAFAACSAPPALLHAGLEGAHRDVSLRDGTARRYFDQGMMLCWGFNHDEAVRSFEAASRIEPGAAMPFWGIAYALGPNLNRRLSDRAVAHRAHVAAQRAVELARRGPATDAERALIDAMAKRYADPPPKDRSALDRAYADAMRAVWQRFPRDADVGVLFADSLMLLSRRWRQWPKGDDRGPYTPEIVATLQRVLKDHPRHAGANHFYIHAIETSTHPERALPSAERLSTLVPGAGHLLHMPAHIYIRTGDYAEAVTVNTRAVAADDAFFAAAGPQQRYHYYRAHNAHFLAWAAMFLGDQATAMRVARDLVAKLPKDELSKLPRPTESYLFVPMHVMLRFGQWNDILEEPAPESRFPLALTLWHHARAIAFANLGRIPEARAEGGAFERAAGEVPPDRKVRQATSAELIDLARHMMRGEVLYKDGKKKEAFVALRRAVEIEDSLPYAEPPGWMQPMRHALGALLLESGEVKEAEAVYRADLAQHAENGWSLHGLAECLRREGRSEEGAEVEKRFHAAWQHADIEIHGSCFCRTR